MSEYNETELAIIQKFGEPSWDIGQQPLNESATRISKSRTLLAALNLSKKSRNNLGNSKSLNIVNGEIVRMSAHIPDPDLKTEDLIAFTDDEVRIIRLYFNNVNQPFKEMADSLGIPYQRVTALLHSDAVKRLYNKVFKSLLALEALVTLRDQLHKGDSKTALEILRDAGVLKSSELNVNVKDSQPIQDPETTKLLKQLGDSLINRKE